MRSKIRACRFRPRRPPSTHYRCNGRGQRIDDARVGQLLESVGIVIAHNAGSTASSSSPACRVRYAALGLFVQEVPWSDAGIASSSSNTSRIAQLLLRRHRAEADCHALLEVLAQPFGATGGTALKVLLDSARSPSFRLWANNSPFETKDVLRNAVLVGCRRRCWSVEVRSQEAVQEELAWLRDAVYAGKSVELDLDEYDARTRYSAREGRRTKLRTSDPVHPCGPFTQVLAT